MSQREILTNGNAFKRTDGRWGGTVWFLDEKGERKRKSFSGTTKSEVNQKMKKYILEFNQQKNDSVESLKTLEESLQNWLQVFKFPAVERTTYDRAESVAKNQIYPRLGKKVVGDITASDIKKLLNYWMTEGYAYTTVKKVYVLLNEYFRYLYQQEIITKNPMANVEMISYVDSRRFIKFIIKLLSEVVSEFTESENRMLQMFHFTIWQKEYQKCGFSKITDGVQKIRECPVLCNEIIELLEYNYNQIDFIDKPVDVGFDCPLDLYCTYTRDQILSALDYLSPSSVQAGTFFLADKKIDIHFITLNKSEKDYSPTTMYNDYSINSELFHWQSQGATSDTSNTGTRYINHQSKLMSDSGVSRIHYTMATGYSRKILEVADDDVSEITAHAYGVRVTAPREYRPGMIVDIGGQDSKIIYLDANYSVKNFSMNDKCAAGTGKFMEVIAQILETTIDQVGPLSLESTAPCDINSTCVVFAQSEVISLIARKYDRRDILSGMHLSMAKRIIKMMKKSEKNGDVLMTGGGALNIGLRKAFEDELMRDVFVAKHPQFNGAIGAALLASERG